ncbi:hypothetical protein [Enterococcus hermanniensis]|uniref:Integral membrane protein n=1 Tax=Enterococcus hermanniensis TaxID=249189 RepID=A0A1L8TR96_9ENTE|nr:hypothetical protein [Enterococcus hermanniensis]OJG46708.1 hypothetical protein RV04_GL001136 [Enterococcus hermanniensis]
MLNKKIIRLLPFIFFIIPYVHITLAMDYLFHSIIGLLLFTIVSISIGFYAKRSYQIPLLIFGNGLNFLLSIFLVLIESPITTFYHSSSPLIASIPLLLLFFIAQLTGIFWGSLFSKKNTVTTK